MKHFLIITAAVLGLAGTAWSAAPLTLQQQMEASRKALEETCKPNCRHPSYEPSQEQWNAFLARDRAEGEIKLRKMGMAPDVASKAIWAAQNKPGSACTQYVHQLLSDYDSGADRGGYDEDLVISIEHSGTCERKNLD
ncbi:hypothetical protein NQF87_08440 [Bombella sp. TMW 2.2559]|uniref:Uncharacterized protein n=1 Tax=Bombella dulcis TaxID=2967339 RepID=A0ABT3WGT4_9PROT|nr:hypothetical protein [Bombella dulcis]MCX5616994.1 hypothetical protein [Bombella dulcis]